MKILIELADESEIDTKLPDILRRRGWIVTKGTERIWSQKELCERFQISSRAMSRRLKHPRCPEFHGTRGEGGSITGVMLTPDLEAFLTQRFTNQEGKKR